MDEATVIALALVTFGWAVVSERLATRNLTGPLVFLLAGFVLANPNWGIVDVDIESSTVHHLAEITLGLVLFADASAVPVKAVRHDLPLTSRLLGIGLPLSILAGTAVAVVLFPSLPLALALVIGASLAPTDAALSATVIADERLPARVRRVLNVESGLNDGVATPVVTFAIAAAATAIGVTAHSYDSGFGAVGELAIGVAIGGAVGLVGGRLVRFAHQQGWAQHGTLRLGTLALALMAFQISSEVGGNPFVSAFVGGLVFGGASTRTGADEAAESEEPETKAAEAEQPNEPAELTEQVGSVLSLVLWFIFGAAFVLPAFEELDAATVAYAVLSLTIVRMVPVAIALLGSGERRSTVAFIGWFGPRGLASVVFALLAVEELGGTDPRVITAIDAIAITIVLSIVAHGVTARPLATRYVATPASTPPR
ncbi:MAG TPA: cation:proton antiporter [Ilumatobacteraceae bacterium]